MDIEKSIKLIVPEVRMEVGGDANASVRGNINNNTYKLNAPLLT